MKTITFLGDSITSGYGIAKNSAYPTIFAEAAKEKGWSLDVVNAGVNGDTTADGVWRVSRLLRLNPDYLVIALGGNDMLRGVPVQKVRDNLNKIIAEAKSAGSRPILFGMVAAPLYGL